MRQNDNDIDNYRYRLKRLRKYKDDEQTKTKEVTDEQKEIVYDSVKARNVFFDTKWYSEIPQYRCENPYCNKQVDITKITIHHIISQSIAPELMYVPENMIALCDDCHKKTHNLEYGGLHNLGKDYSVSWTCGYCKKPIDPIYRKYNCRVLNIPYHPTCFLKAYKKIEQNNEGQQK